MDSKGAMRYESAKQAREKKASLEQKPKLAKSPPIVSNLLVELATLKLQTKDFFERERDLSGAGLNPRHAPDMACVIVEKLEEVWGKCSSFKTTNTTLNLDTKQELLLLYAKIYGKGDVTNNEFMTWIIKGFIAAHMGFEGDWATVEASTALLLASWLEGEILRRDLISNESAQFM